MSRTRAFVWLVAVAVASGAFGLVAFGASAATRQPRLSFASVSPLAVRGSGFVAHERVTVVVSAGKRYLRRVRASAAGTFTARFPSLRIGSCTAFAVRAHGDRGSVAVRLLNPLCAPAGPALVGLASGYVL